MAALLTVGALGVGAYLAWPNPPEHATPYKPDAPTEIPTPPKTPQEAWTIRPEEGRPIRYAQSGHAALRFPTIPEVFKEAVAKHGDDPALKIEKAGYPATEGGEWQTITWREYHKLTTSFAKALMNAGHQPFESVAICGFNHPMWFVAHMGAIVACGLSAGTYSTNSAEVCAFVANDSKAVVAVCDTVANAKKYLSKLAETPRLKYVIVYSDTIPDDLAAKHAGVLLGMGEFLATGKDLSDDELDARSAQCKIENAATLIYTSGTTGNPKAVMASHDSMMYSSAVVVNSLAGELVRSISYLPLSHIAAQILDIFIPMYYTSRRDKGESVSTVYFARPDVLKGSLPITLKAVRPTSFFGVPRVWEKFAEAIKTKAKENPATGLKKRLVDFAKDVGLRASYARQSGGDGYIPRGYPFVKRKIFSAIKQAIGLDQCRFFMTGAAPIGRGTLEYLASLGMDICEVYGMSETMGQGSMSLPTKFKFGSCGWKTPSMELKIDHVDGRDKAGEGEICFRGRHVMMGYMNNEAKTREAIDPEGWMHSGDIGRMDSDGQLYITGRIKELIIGAGGENIAPVPVEEAIKGLCPALSNVVMIGNNRKYNVMLVTLRSRPNVDTGDFFDDLIGDALEVNPSVKTVTAARSDAAWQAHIQKALDTYNSKHAPSNAQKIQKFVILPKDLSLAGEELTATMKLKRNVVEEKYAALIDGLYAGSD
jgi:long-chain-fatty-acid--CoA ligase ACSBG